MYPYIISNIPEDLVSLVHSFVDPETTYIQTTLHAHPLFERVVGGGFKNEHYLNINQAMCELPMIYEPALSKKIPSSYIRYSLRYYRNLYDKIYISRDETVCALLLLGYVPIYSNDMLVFKIKYTKLGHKLNNNRWKMPIDYVKIKLDAKAIRLNRRIENVEKQKQKLDKRLEKITRQCMEHMEL